ncbi:hemolysin family protein [Truepera radiovictrix]|uniref:hemolysin family protein n=1 Tax=Truepera radiovictrix TaxID=332249 RepID=UPI00031C9F9B|nr:hemolysin family protein [Truepera radiovictrix]WMT58447.1 hemolysin family protein [Truepera radiovictrix]
MLTPVAAVWLAASSAVAFAAPVTPTEGGVTPTQVLLLVLLFALSAFMSGAETALTAVGHWKIRQLREEGQDPTGAFALLERDRARFITTLLIGNNLVNIAATALVTQITLRLAAPLGVGESLALAYATGLMTFLVLIFGEITPKSFAVQNAVPLSRVVIRPVYYLSVVVYPIGRFFTFIANLILRLFRLETTANPLITEDELRLMLRSAEESGVIEAHEQEMIRGIIDLEETVVREVMTPRVDVVAISEDATLEELLELVTKHGYSRLPVYSETIDNVRGTVYARDLLAYLGRSEALHTTRVADLMTPAQYVPETLSILNLLRDMRARKNHIAIVVDEFGGTAGIVTLEDIIEEITGEIYDETDQEEAAPIVPLDEGVFRIQGSAHLEEVGAELKLTLGEGGEYDTLAGFLISRFGHIPQPGETLDIGTCSFTIEEADERRVISVLASLHDALGVSGALPSPTSGTAEPGPRERTQV